MFEEDSKSVRFKMRLEGWKGASPKENKERERKNACEKPETRPLWLLRDELGERCRAIMLAMKAWATECKTVD